MPPPARHVEHVARLKLAIQYRFAGAEMLMTCAGLKAQRITPRRCEHLPALLPEKLNDENIVGVPMPTEGSGSAETQVSVARCGVPRESAHGMTQSLCRKRRAFQLVHHHACAALQEAIELCLVDSTVSFVDESLRRYRSIFEYREQRRNGVDAMEQLVDVAPGELKLLDGAAHKADFFLEMIPLKRLWRHRKINERPTTVQWRDAMHRFGRRLGK